MELYLHFPNTSSWHGALLSAGVTLPLSFASNSNGCDIVLFPLCHNDGFPLDGIDDGYGDCFDHSDHFSGDSGCEGDK